MSEETDSKRTVTVFPEGTNLFTQEDSSRDLYIIKKGCVKIVKREGDIDIELDRIGPGGVVGEVAAIDGGKRSAVATAVEDTEAVIISRNDFAGIIGNLPEWFRKIAVILVQRLREVDDKIDHSYGGDKTRHAAYLLALMTYGADGRPAGEGFEIPGKRARDELVDLLNMRIPQVEEIMEALQKRGLIRMEKGRCIVGDRAALEAFGEEVFAAAQEAPAT